MHRTELELRLINFSVSIIDLVKKIPEGKAGTYLAGQLLRSGISPALNYGEAQSGESKRDFIHKLQIVLKELRETYVCLRIITQAGEFTFEGNESRIAAAERECNELISIFVKSIQTTKKNLQDQIMRQ